MRMFQKIEWFVLGVVFIATGYAMYNEYQLAKLYTQDHTVLVQIVNLINSSQAK